MVKLDRAWTFNASEIFGAGAAAGMSRLYYPSQERTFTKTYQLWLTSIAIDAGSNRFKEFWPDMNYQSLPSEETRGSAGKRWEENTAAFDCVADHVSGRVSEPPPRQSGKWSVRP